MTRVVLAAVVAIMTFAPAVTAGSGTPPALRVDKRAPLTLVGTRFVAGERVEVTLAWRGTHRLKRTATATGTFRATFTDVTLSRCDRLTGRAVGNRGSSATVKLLPAPGCIAQ